VDQGFGITKLIDGFGIAGLSNSNGSSVMIVKTNNSGNTDTGWTKYLAF
jgi:hypothetical protein